MGAPNAVHIVIPSLISFINENGKANLVPNRPVIREGTVIFWRDGDERLRWSTVASKRMDLTETAPVALITRDPTCVVDVEDVLYAWPTREDLWKPGR